MKKIVIMMLVAIVPLLTIAQKRSKKADKPATERIKSSKASVEYMVIRGIAMPMNMRGNENSTKLNTISKDVDEERDMKRMLNPERLMIVFDYGNIKNNEVVNNEVVEMRRASSSLRSMAAAANAAAEKGWEFMSANVVSNIKSTTHYYYMKRNKKNK